MADIGALNEKPLHASLKAWYARGGAALEVTVDGFVADVLTDDLVIEIQTRNFSSLRRKLDHLLDQRRLLLVHPVAATKWIVKVDDDGVVTSRRRSPKRGLPVDVCAELVSFPTLLSHPNFALEVVMVDAEEIWRPDPAAWRRNGWAIEEQRLLDVVDTIRLERPDDLHGFLPEGLPTTFTTADLAKGLGRTRHLAQEVAYCLRLSGAVEEVGRDRRGILYRRP